MPCASPLTVGSAPASCPPFPAWWSAVASVPPSTTGPVVKSPRTAVQPAAATRRTKTGTTAREGAGRISLSVNHPPPGGPANPIQPEALDAHGAAMPRRARASPTRAEHAAASDRVDAGAYAIGADGHP